MTGEQVDGQITTVAGELRRARRASFAAALRHASVLYATAWGGPCPAAVVEELEMAARLEAVAKDELRKRAHR